MRGDPNYYDAVPEGVVNDRFIVEFGTQDRHYDYFTTEYFAPRMIQDECWEVCEGIGPSFSYNQNESDDSVKSSAEIVHRLADAVSKNGNLLLGVGPTASGEIVELQRARLLEVGEWLDVNGEAIYATRPWHRHRAETDAGCEVRFTARDDVVVRDRARPRHSGLEIPGLALGPDARVSQLGRDAVVDVERKGRATRFTGVASSDPRGAVLRLDGVVDWRGPGV